MFKVVIPYEDKVEIGSKVRVNFAGKETMATGVYATNMEIEMLKKALARESNRLERINRGESVSPAREIPGLDPPKVLRNSWRNTKRRM